MAASAPTGNLPESTEEPDLVVLAGGAGTRMGNADKGLVQIDGLSLAETLLSRLGTRKRRVIISANRNQPLYQKMCDQVVSDQRSGFAGPLAGIEAALTAVKSAVCVVLPCDMPGLPADLPAALVSRLGHDGSAVYLHDGARPQPLCLALRSAAVRQSLSDFLDRGERSVIRWLESIQAQALDGRHWPENSWVNVNSTQELENLIARA